ncbi:hypothetical protein RJD11_09745 [Bacillus velezensis]|uniref:hypothetical protein n=1 Tax=Bacillus TaxID=1386 RepID=UPI001C52D06D|nr:MULTISPECIES: hypothetical protein [Bacillus amyloliquefaciens group]MBV2197585.1 hypothetical protein [Bacillus velezensis]QXP98955.1 hypothetical protein KVY05_09660 [Bacillus velezensis]UHH04783.1 hypothetical protein LUA14_09705 [Bacillus amyloliquefaciens]ULR24510.1 hypothetical protein MJE83_09705 [Bacillus velezensis]UVW11320.1 hypothetical protein NX856_09740 [Bacillus velezensis]
MNQNNKVLTSFIYYATFYKLADSKGFKILPQKDHLEIFAPFYGSDQGVKIKTDEDLAEVIQDILQYKI